MARKLKFSLIHNNQPIRTLDDLRKDCDLNQLLIDYREGKLKRWLETFRIFDNLIQTMDNSIVLVLDKKKSSQDDLEVAKELVEILGLNNKKLTDYEQKFREARKFVEIGLNCYNLQEYEKAIAEYEQALEINPSNASIYQNRGNAYRELQNKTKAIADYSEALKLNPMNLIPTIHLPIIDEELTFLS